MQTPIYVRSATDAEKLGIVVSEHLFPTPMQDPNTGETRIEFVSLLGVCWEETRTPAIDYVYPRDLEWVAIEGVTDEEEDDEEDEDEEEDEDTEVDQDQEFENRASDATSQ